MIDFIITGAQKGGTTAAAFNLNKHPEIAVFSGITEYGQYEIEFFNQHWDRGIQWYFDQLPRSKGVRGEKTAELLHRTICHERIFAIRPKVKLIVLLRSPVERSYSQWKMASLIKKDEPRNFDEVVQTEITALTDNSYKHNFYQCAPVDISCWREGYVIKGFYHEQIESLYSYFEKDNIYIGISERIRANKKMEYNKIFSFLNVGKYNTNFEDRFEGKPTTALSKKSKDLLEDVYRGHNEKLFNLLGYDIPEWNLR